MGEGIACRPMCPRRARGKYLSPLRAEGPIAARDTRCRLSKPSAGFHDELTRIRRDIHAHPELGFEEQRTSDLVAGEARRVRRHRGASRPRQDRRRRTAAGRQLAAHDRAARRYRLPADPGIQYSSRTARRITAGCMPAAMTGTRRCCSARRAIWRRRRNFDGTVHFIFQPAEEGLGGAEAMVKDGLFDEFPCDVDLRHAQPARACRRQIPDPRRRDDGRRRVFRHRDHRQGRARRAARGRHRPGAGRQPHHDGAAVDRVAQRAAGRYGRCQRHADPRRRRLQRHPGARRAARHGALLQPRRDEHGRGADAADRRGRRRRVRRVGQPRFPRPVSAAGQSRRRGPVHRRLRRRHRRRGERQPAAGR